ncbi:MAG: phosphoglycerate dehydrogenase [Candidatus Gastranaerophilales bacterium]|nr:phosphoglycerate dehydrogenase [Candidatus Gastranaerophilales bacterium]
MKVLVTDKINETAGNIISPAAEVDFLPTMPEDELVKIIPQYDALMVRSQTKVTPKIIEAGKNLKIIGRAGVGVDNIDLESATQNGIIVVNSPDGNTMAAAEHTIALMLAMARNIVPAALSTKDGKWERSKFTGCELYNKTLGIIGLGKIGSHVAEVALALGMKLVVFDPFASKELVEKTGCEYIKNLDDFWCKCDFITVHVPKTKDTVNMINKDTIKKMKKGVRLVNCARGGIINEQDLKEAIESAQVAAAAIDVYENEPNIDSCPLIHTSGNIVLTPHLGASTQEAQLNVAIDVAEQIKEVLTGGSASSAVNIPSLRPDKLEPVKDYMQIAENSGELAMQIAGGVIKSIEITAQGDLSDLDIQPLEVAVLKGALSSLLVSVNYVNAPVLAKKRGIDIISSRSKAKCNFAGLLTVKLTTDKAVTTVAGALVAKDIPRIVKINDYETSIRPEKHMLIVPHLNQPSMIAKVAQVLGENNINIGSMNVVQKNDRHKTESIMVINVDSEVNDTTLCNIDKIEGVHGSKYVKLTTQE